MARGKDKEVNEVRSTGAEDASTPTSSEANISTDNTPENTGTDETVEREKTVYKFISENKFLTCAGLGIQFVNGKAETNNLEIAKALCTISGVTRVED